MDSHSELTDNAFEEDFRLCRLSPSLFTHEAHLRLAWIHLKKYGLHKALTNIEKQIRAFVKHVGAEDKYHQTLTIAAVRMVNHFMIKSKTNNFQDFIVENSELKTNFKELISSHYSFDIFASKKAKTIYMDPDMTPFVQD